MAGLDIKLGRTQRGFPHAEFKDFYGEACSLQQSSLATESAIWLGIEDPDIQVMVKGKGWQKAVLPEGALIKSRMHLTQEQVQDLLPYPQHFAETGELSTDPRNWTP